MKTTKAFTLIELLIVVAIIAILAAIAVPNFLEAQTRSKVSRAKADMRSIATALEAYRVDSNRYPGPYEYGAGVAWIPANSGIINNFNQDFHSRVPSKITTPIAYMSSIPVDAFRAGDQVLTGAEADYNGRNTYFNFEYFKSLGYTTVETFNRAEALAGAWLLYSPGPDRDEFNREGGPTGPINARRVYIDYDPTNGTLSLGNIFRTQNNGELLGVDEWFLQ